MAKKMPPWLMKGKGKDEAPAKGGKPNPFAKKAAGGKKMPAFKKGGMVKGKC